MGLNYGLLLMLEKSDLQLVTVVDAGEVHEECSWYSAGGDGRRVRCGQSNHTPQQHQGVWQETQRLVRTHNICCHDRKLVS